LSKRLWLEAALPQNEGRALSKGGNLLQLLEWKFNRLSWLFALALYFMLHGLYRIENIDDAWFLSFAYELLFHDNVKDVAFGADINTGSTAHLFGNVHIYLYGMWLNFCGWTKSAAHIFSTGLIWLSAGMWYLIVRRDPLVPASVASSLAWLMVLADPFFSAANDARPDALAFFFASSALLAATRSWWLIAGTLCFVAFETHAAGAVAFLWVGAYAWIASMKAGQKLALLGGFLLGGSGYCLLHWQYMPDFWAMVGHQTPGRNNSPGTIFTAYFMDARYYRHVPELVAFLAAAWLCLRRKTLMVSGFPRLLLFCSIGMLFLFPRGNFHYMLFVCPGLLLWLLVCFAERKKLSWIMIFFLFLFGTQYLVQGWLNYGFDMGRYVSQVRSAVPQDSLPVIGGGNAWFSMKEREYRVYNMGLREDYPEAYLVTGHYYHQPHADRSEERRVGKECRSRWSPYH